MTGSTGPASILGPTWAPHGGPQCAADAQRASCTIRKSDLEQNKCPRPLPRPTQPPCPRVVGVAALGAMRGASRRDGEWVWQEGAGPCSGAWTRASWAVHGAGQDGRGALVKERGGLRRGPPFMPGRRVEELGEQRKGSARPPTSLIDSERLLGTRTVDRVVSRLTLRT